MIWLYGTHQNIFTMSPKNKEQAILTQIKKNRNSKGYSQQYLAMRLGIDQSAFQKIEAGISSLKLIHFFKILEALEIDFETFSRECFEIKNSKIDLSDKFSEIERLLNEIKNHSIG